MKIRLINIAEIVSGILLSVGFILTRSFYIDFGWLALIGSFLLSVLYFPFGFFTLRSPNVHVANSVTFGLLFSFSVIGIIFNLMKIDMSLVLLIVMIACFLIVAFLRAFVLFLFINVQILNYNNGIAIRYLVLFVYMIYALLSYKLR